MKLIKILSALLIAMFATQIMPCQANGNKKGPNKKPFLQWFVDGQTRKDLIKYDVDDDEIVLFLNKSGRLGALAIFTAILGLTAVGTGITAYAAEVKSEKTIAATVAACTAIATILFLILTLKMKNTKNQYFRLSPEGLEKFNNLIMAWNDISEAKKTEILHEARFNFVKSNQSQAKLNAVKYLTEKGSCLFELKDEPDFNNPLSYQDFQGLIKYYLKKYGNQKTEDVESVDFVE